MKKLVVVIVFFTSCSFAQDMRQNAARSLFSDQKAVRVGDAVTILVIENARAANDAKTSASRESGLSFSGAGKTGSTTLPEVGLNIAAGNSFKGEGSATAQGSVNAKISAHVDSINGNGNLYVSGSRTISVNGEEQVIQIFGIVRPSDIQADNSVFSYNISDAHIVYRGSGIVSNAQEPGWLTKFFHWLF